MNDSEPPIVQFIHVDGRSEYFAARPGDTLLDVALDNGVAGIIGQCGGGCTCCTCHCWVAEAWLEHLRAPHPDELEMLEYAWGRKSCSRLACQVPVTPELNGIQVYLPEHQS